MKEDEKKVSESKPEWGCTQEVKEVVEKFKLMLDATTSNESHVGMKENFVEPLRTAIHNAINNLENLVSTDIRMLCGLIGYLMLFNRPTRSPDTEIIALSWMLLNKQKLPDKETEKKDEDGKV